MMVALSRVGWITLWIILATIIIYLVSYTMATRSNTESGGSSDRQ